MGLRSSSLNRPHYPGSSDIHGSNVEFSVREGIDSECSPLLFPGGQILKWPELKVFSFKELKSATENFKSARLVGEGRFGIVYKGWLDEKTLTPAKPGSGVGVAIKMFNTEGTRGFLLCQSEINVLGRLSHPNVVRLLGYCREEDQFLLVYEFMPKGSLECHLFQKNHDMEPLSWNTRLKIVIGAARGLAFLHANENKVMFRDFNTSNILLDGNYNAKIADFWLAEGLPGEQSRVSSSVIIGYVAPEYTATARMEKNRKLSRLQDLCIASRLVAVFFLFQNLGFCCSLNEEGNALLKFRQRIVSDPFGALSNWVDDDSSFDPCNWFGVECSDGRVVALNLKDLCLEGTLAPELAKLIHIKSIILRNNSFSGTIPEGFVELKELEVLDLGYNNFSGHIPADLGSNISLAILLLDNNEFLVGFSPEINELRLLSECQVGENQLTSAAKMPACIERATTWHIGQGKGTTRGLLQLRKSFHRTHEDPRNRAANPPQEKPSLPSPPSPVPKLTPSEKNASNSPTPHSTPGSGALPKTEKSTSPKVHILVGVIGGAVFLLFSTIGLYICKTKVVNVRPWATGLSGQLEKAFVTGAQKLRRLNLEVACEDFSNVIGTSPIGTVYKGTLSSGVEIAVISVPVTSSKNWSKTLEVQFRNKIDTLSKVNHKNFVNLIGYCEEEEPFTRMLVFEYAPNGTLFEHLHIKEAEHLDWVTRLRVATGMAYCLQHMHQLDPPMALIKLNSQTVYLTDDYAAKLSDFSFSYEITSAETKAIDMPKASLETNVYSFGALLFEIVTGRLPYSVEQRDSLENWASHYIQGDQPLKDMVDPILESYQEGQLEQVAALIKSCVHPDPKQRPIMKDVSEKLREITKITPESAVPKLSPLWWAELEIASTEVR